MFDNQKELLTAKLAQQHLSFMSFWVIRNVLEGTVDSSEHFLSGTKSCWAKAWYRSSGRPGLFFRKKVMFIITNSVTQHRII